MHLHLVTGFPLAVCLCEISLWVWCRAGAL